jgi:hypothetical protein
MSSEKETKSRGGIQQNRAESKQDKKRREFQKKISGIGCFMHAAIFWSVPLTPPLLL